MAIGRRQRRPVLVSQERWELSQMTRLLQMAGAPINAVRLVPDIVQTCRICRTCGTWAPVAPDTKAAVGMSTRFNQAVQA